MSMNPDLTRARELLPAELMREINKQPFTVRGWRILERWAFNSPTQLEALAKQGTIIFINRLLDQQQIEHAALVSALNAGQTHLAQHEVLELAGVSTELA